MKKWIVFFCVAMLMSRFVSAQFAPLSAPQIKKQPVKTQVSPGLTSTPTRPATAPPPAPVYYLSDVQVSIGTGADNKESLSNVAIEFWVRNKAYAVYAQYNVTNELPANSTRTYGLERSATYTSGVVNGSVPLRYLTDKSGVQLVKYSDIQANGIALRIIYKPNLFTDAWKVETVSVSFSFRDINGNQQPGVGTKTIRFDNAANFMDCFDKRQLICTADGNLTPLTAFVVKDVGRLW